MREGDDVLFGAYEVIVNASFEPTDEALGITPETRARWDRESLARIFDSTCWTLEGLISRLESITQGYIGARGDFSYACAADVNVWSDLLAEMKRLRESEAHWKAEATLFKEALRRLVAH